MDCIGAVKTEILADNHYKRVTSFAKEMLVFPEGIEVHRVRNPLFQPDLKPSIPAPPLPVRYLSQKNSKTDLDDSRSKNGAAAASHRQSPVRVQPPMKFKFKTGIERLADALVQQGHLDPSPTRRTELGSDMAVLNLRPNDFARMLGAPHLALKAKSSIQQRLDRMSMEIPRELPIDPNLVKLNKRNTIERSLQKMPTLDAEDYLASHGKNKKKPRTKMHTTLNSSAG